MGKRARPHEGLDLCVYRTEKGDIRYLDEKTKVPVILKGRIVKVVDDFLGESTPQTVVPFEVKDSIPGSTYCAKSGNKQRRRWSEPLPPHQAK
ncbi:hypothetical protein ACFLTZ_00815 [Chloroflexota bacterium]